MKYSEVYRVGKRVGDNVWQVKQGPGWRIVHKCANLHEAADWLSGKDVDLSSVRVVSALPGFDIAWGWPTLRAAIENVSRGKKGRRSSQESVSSVVPK